MPIIKISDSEKGNNKGSVGSLVAYLEKENVDKSKENYELWFNNHSSDIPHYEVLNKIDANKKGLKNKEAKFFLVNIAPSEKELGFLIQKYGAHELKDRLKDYSNKVMDAYAKNFKREGIQSSDQLLYFGKVEQYRYLSHADSDVLIGLNKKGEIKSGLNWHTQIIVSRKDKSMKYSLSPLNASSGKNNTHSSAFGQFNMKNFKLESEKVFDQMFQYKRELNESFFILNIKKNGSAMEKARLMINESVNTIPRDLDSYKSRSISDNVIMDFASMFKESGVVDNPIENESAFERKKRLQKRGKENDQSR